jgi:hypothetical protein
MKSEEVKEDPRIKITLENVIKNLKVLSDFYYQNSNSEKSENVLVISKRFKW